MEGGIGSHRTLIWKSLLFLKLGHQDWVQYAIHLPSLPMNE
jgi:hypothetical protein